MSVSIEIIVNKSEITAGTRGASLGPEAVMTAARKKGSLLFGQYPISYSKTRNDLLDQEIKFPYAKRIEGLVEVYDEMSSRVKTLLNDHKFPLVLAGDHGSAGGTIAGVKAAYPNSRIGVVWIDAHGDLHTPYTTPSGNMHGMPLATALNEDNYPCERNEISDYEKQLWDRLKNTAVEGQKVRPEDLIFIAVRDTEDEENKLIERLGIKNHTVSDVRAKGADVIIEKIENQLSGCEVIYVSFDVDSMDPTFTSHGTGTPVPEGLSPKEAEEILCKLASLEKVKCLEVVEVNPCLDENVNKMAEVTYSLVESVVNTLEQR